MFALSFMQGPHWKCWVLGETTTHFAQLSAMLTGTHSQEVGRAGRDGEHALCYTIPCKKTTTFYDSLSKDNDHKGQMAMADWLFGPWRRCLRFTMTKFIDGIGQQCSNKPNTMHCSWCKVHPNDVALQRPSISFGLTSENSRATNSALGKRPAAHQAAGSFTEAYASSKRRRQEKGAGQDAYVDQFKLALGKFNGICAFCRVFGHINAYHSILNCETMVSNPTLTTSRDTYRTWKRQLQYKEKLHGQICFFCHVPQCHELLHDIFQSSAGSCQHPDVVGGVAYAVFHNTVLCSKAQEFFSKTWLTADQFAQWLNEAPTIGHKTNMTALFLWYSSTI